MRTTNVSRKLKNNQKPPHKQVVFRIAKKVLDFAGLFGVFYSFKTFRFLITTRINPSDPKTDPDTPSSYSHRSVREVAEEIPGKAFCPEGFLSAFSADSAVRCSFPFVHPPIQGLGEKYVGSSHSDIESGQGARLPPA